ncbi:MAG: hypothetical protein HGB30_13330 [Holophagaceae bacterium]|nr:hypothetical protein [Holophagaceae bacterium]
MRSLMPFLAAMTLLAQEPKPSDSAVLWTYDSPREFHLVEPSYRFPIQVKQALVQVVQPSPTLCRDYLAVFRDKRTFCPWFRKVLLEHRDQQAKAVQTEGKVLSSDPSKVSADGGRVLSTAKVRPRKAPEPVAMDVYLEVLKLWESEGSSQPRGAKMAPPPVPKPR